MRKIIKKWGNNLVIVFTKEDTECFELKRGDVIAFEFMKQELIDAEEERLKKLEDLPSSS